VGIETQNSQPLESRFTGQVIDVAFYFLIDLMESILINRDSVTKIIAFLSVNTNRTWIYV
jgi:hypothetical protein